jgi:hypothetical protein
MNIEQGMSNAEVKKNFDILSSLLDIRYSPFFKGES